MGSVFGKESVKEPPFEVLLERTNAKTGYEIRQYGERFAASVTYPAGGNDDTGSPFRTLARYIGVFGTPENEGSTSIAMTAPVVMEKDGAAAAAPESIAMTAPVVMENSAGDDGMKKMMFMLPSEYDAMDKIPKPTNPSVHIEELPKEVGVVHRYNGSMDNARNKKVAEALGSQLMEDGVAGITEEYVMDNFQFWGYNPPFCLPYFRRNEVWLKLNDDQVSYLKDKFPASNSEARLVGGSPSGMKGSTKFALASCGLVLGAYAVGIVLKSRTQYRRL